MECSIAADHGPNHLSHLCISTPSFFHGETVQLPRPPPLALPAPPPLHQLRAGCNGYTESWSCSGGGGGECTFPDGTLRRSFPSDPAAFPDDTLRHSFPSDPAAFPDGILRRSFPSDPAAFPTTFPNGTLRCSFPSSPAVFPCSNKVFVRHHHHHHHRLMPSHYPELMQYNMDPGVRETPPLLPPAFSGYYDPSPPLAQYISPENPETRSLQTCKLSRLSLVGRQYALRIFEATPQLEEFFLEKVRSRFLDTIISTHAQTGTQER